MISRMLKSAALAVLVATAAHAVPAKAPEARRDRPMLPPATHLSEWRDKKFFGPKPRRVVAVLAKARGGAPGFTAFGVDVDKQRVVFQIALSVDELSAMTAQLTKELYQPTQSNPTDAFLSEILGQLINPPPPPPSPGGDERLARELIAVATKNINTQLKGLTAPGTR